MNNNSSPFLLLGQLSSAKRKHSTEDQTSSKRQNRSPFSPIQKSFTSCVPERKPSPSPFQTNKSSPFQTNYFRMFSSPESLSSNPPTPSPVKTPPELSEMYSKKRSAPNEEHQKLQTDSFSSPLAIDNAQFPNNKSAESDENKKPTSLVENHQPSPKKLTYYWTSTNLQAQEVDTKYWYENNHPTMIRQPSSLMSFDYFIDVVWLLLILFVLNSFKKKFKH